MFPEAGVSRGRAVVIGATGHIGSYLVPRLVAGGYEVVAISRGSREPYVDAGEWRFARRQRMDREAAEREGTFGQQIAALEPDVVFDLICFSLDQCRQLASALEGRVRHLLHCGTIWVHGPSGVVPTLESAPRHPFGEYGIQKAQIEAYLLDRARRGRLPATVLHPGHIVGTGWKPINPAGNLNLDVFERLATGRPLALPGRGLATLHHVHADDVAQAFELAAAQPSASVGESFHVTSAQAVTLLGYAREAARWFGREAQLEFLPWEDWKETVGDDDAAATWDHVAHSPVMSIAKAERFLGYRPRYSSFEAVRESVAWLVREGRIETAPAGVPQGPPAT